VRRYKRVREEERDVRTREGERGEKERREGVSKRASEETAGAVVVIDDDVVVVAITSCCCCCHC
jgi:hypothetical protein